MGNSRLAALTESRPSESLEVGVRLDIFVVCQAFSYPLKFRRQTGISFRTFARTIDRLTPSSSRSWR
jgi:hypothetical protein